MSGIIQFRLNIRHGLHASSGRHNRRSMSTYFWKHIHYYPYGVDENGMTSNLIMKRLIYFYSLDRVSSLAMPDLPTYIFIIIYGQSSKIYTLFNLKHHTGWVNDQILWTGLLWNAHLCIMYYSFGQVIFWIFDSEIWKQSLKFQLRQN